MTTMFLNADAAEQRSMLRTILNEDLKKIRGEFFIDGDFKWLIQHATELDFPDDPNHPAEVNKGLIIELSSRAGCTWQKMYGYANELSERVGLDLKSTLVLLNRLIRRTPRGISRADVWEYGATIKMSDTRSAQAYKLKFTVSELEKYGIIVQDSIILGYAHIHNLDLKAAMEDNIMDRFFQVAKDAGYTGLTVTPQHGLLRADYESIGFERYTTDGIMRYTFI